MQQQTLAQQLLHGVAEYKHINWTRSTVTERTSAKARLTRDLDHYQKLIIFWATVCKTGPTSPPPKGGRAPNFRPMSTVAKWLDEDATWYGSRPQPRPRCVRLRPSSTLPRKGHSSSAFRPISIVATVAHLSYCWALVHWPNANLPWRFNANLFGSFCTKLLTVRQTDNDDYITSLAEVITEYALKITY